MFATMHAERVSDDDLAELMRLHGSIRGHWALLSGRGKNPLDGVTWSPDTDRFDALLHCLATQAGLKPEAPPWTNLDRLTIDEQCPLGRRARRTSASARLNRCRADLPVARRSSFCAGRVACVDVPDWAI